MPDPGINSNQGGFSTYDCADALSNAGDISRLRYSLYIRGSPGGKAAYVILFAASRLAILALGCRGWSRKKGAIISEKKSYPSG
jgi:hypothetical protein